MYAPTLIIDSVIRFSLFNDYTNICGAGCWVGGARAAKALSIGCEAAGGGDILRVVGYRHVAAIHTFHFVKQIYPLSLHTQSIF